MSLYSHSKSEGKETIRQEQEAELQSELTPTFRIGAVAGQAQVADKALWEVAGSVGDVAGFNGAPSQLLQARRVVGQVAHKAHHQRVPTQAQLVQVNQVKDLSGKVSQQVIVQAKGTQGMQPKDGDGYPVKMCKQNCPTAALSRPNYSPSSHQFLLLCFLPL